MIHTALGRAFTATLILIVLAGTSLRVEARTGYVNDELEVTLRSGESTRNSIVRMLPSGEQLEVLEVNSETGYARVTTKDGREGFVLSRFVTYEPVARDRLVSANRRLERSAQRISNLEAQLGELKGENTTYSQNQNSLETNNVRLTEELNEIRRTAANAIQTADENRNLRSTKTNLENQIQELQTVNSTLAARSRQLWFMAGAGTLILGILAGLLLPRLKLKRRSKWGDL